MEDWTSSRQRESGRTSEQFASLKPEWTAQDNWSASQLRESNWQQRSIEKDFLPMLDIASGPKVEVRPDGCKLSFDDQGRIDSITYRQQSNRQYRFHYDTAGNIDRMDVCDGTGQIQETRNKTGAGVWNVTKPDGSFVGVWHAEMKVTADGRFLYQEAKERSTGQWHVVAPDCSKYIEKTDGDRTTRIFDDQSKVEFEQTKLGERIVRIARGDCTRDFRYDADGRLSELIDTTPKGSVSWRPEQGNVVISANGDVLVRQQDGTTVKKNADFSTVETDADGDLKRVVNKGGRIRSFQYEISDGKKQLVEIKDGSQDAPAEKWKVWSRKRDADGALTDQFVFTRSNGKEKLRSHVSVLADGTVKYTGPDGKEHQDKAGTTGDASGFSDNVEEARDRLMELMESRLDEPRRARLQVMMARFEQRAADRVEAQTAGGMEREKAQAEWDAKVTKTFDHLAHMLDSNQPKAVYDLDTRVKLVENALFAMVWPAKANDQGNWGCCWQISGVYLGVLQHPDKMARMLDELSTSGTFTDTNGKTWTPPKRLLSFTNQGAHWSIGNCGNGRRSPCSEIWTSVAAYLSRDGRRLDRGAHGGSMQGCMHAMKLITGDTWHGTSQHNMTAARYKKDLLLKGGVILFSPGHMYLGLLEKNHGQWQIASSLQHGDRGRHINGIVRDLRSYHIERSRRHQYVADIPTFPGCKDQPTGKGPVVHDDEQQPWRRRRWWWR